MQTGVLPEPVSNELVGVHDVIRREQYLDFLKGRMFRQTLLCRARTRSRPKPAAADRGELAISSPAQPAGAPDRKGRVTFEGPTGSTLTTDHPLVRRALERVGRGWPGAVWVRAS